MWGNGCPTYAYPMYPSCQGYNENQSWLWIVIIVFVIFFLIWGNGSNRGCNSIGC